MLREKLLLHFLGDGQFVLQPLFFFLLLDQVLDGRSHRVERIGQGSQLVVRLHRNAVAEVSAIDVFGGIVELGHGAGHGAGEASPDEQRQQFDDRENHRREQQQILHAGGKIAQGGEQTGVEHRGPGLDPEQRARFLLLAGRPIHHRKRRSESDFAIEAVAGRGQERRP